MRPVLQWIYHNALEWITGAILAVIVVLTSVQVVSRYAFSSPFNWIEEFCQLLLVWSVMIGAAATVKTNGHLTVDILFQRLHGRPRQVAVLLLNAGVMALAIGMIWYGLQFYQKTAGDYATSLGFARNLFYLPIPVSGGLIAIFLFPATWRALQQEEQRNTNAPVID